MGIARTLLASALAVVGLAPAAAANDIAKLEIRARTDVAYAGYGGMRGLGTGSLTLDGVDGTVRKAYLYWHGPVASIDDGANATVTFAGTEVTGANIGISSDNCWGLGRSHAYRADVTSLVSGDGAYALSNFRKSGSVEINGASLVVFYRDADPDNNRDIVLFDGNDSNTPNGFDAYGWNVTLEDIEYTEGAASLDLHVSDGQTFVDDYLMLNGEVLAPAGAVFNGNTVPNGPGGPSNGGLWDIRSFDVTSFLDPGTNALSLTTELLYDCLSLVVAAVNLPAGAAPSRATTLTADPVIVDVSIVDAALFFPDLSATLRLEGSGEPLPGRTVSFLAGNEPLCEATTDAGGVARCTGAGLPAVLNLGYRAVFEGDEVGDDFLALPSEARGSLVRVNGTGLP